ncbi:MAG: helix-turn-helix transcriptional regulator [Nannocystales bacterium]
MDPEPNEETKVSEPTSPRQGGASDDPTTPRDGEAVDPALAGDDAEGREEGDSSSPGGPSTAPAPDPTPGPAARKRSTRSRPKAGTHPNNVRRLRQRAMMSKAELARRAGVSPLTIDRVESGCPCRMDTKRKILEALGIQPASAVEVFPDVDLD